MSLTAPSRRQDAGRLLRQLRKARGMTLTDLSLAIDKPTNEIKSNKPTKTTWESWLSRLETGKQNLEDRTKLITIFDALDKEGKKLNKGYISHGDREFILETFGYRDDARLPNETDIENAIRAWQPHKALAFPAYLLDYANRVHDWNEPTLRFINVDANSDKLKGLTVFDLAFSEEFQTRTTQFSIVNRNEFLRILTTDVKSEYREYDEQEWCKNSVAEAMRKYPEFKEIWDGISEDEVYEFAIRHLKPLILSIPGYGQLEFEITGVELPTDRRFRTVLYQPLNAETGQKCYALGLASPAG